jgi:UDP:flavonoid glycosyltransferase YjiC (YdhE family)
MLLAMKILITSVPVQGHLNPLLSIGSILLRNRHEVIVYTASHFGERVKRIGAEFRPMHPKAGFSLGDQDELHRYRNSLSPGPKRLRFDYEHFFIDPIPYQDAGLKEVLSDWPADAILADLRFYGTVPMLLGPRSARPFIVHCGISSLWSLNRDDGAPAGPGLLPAKDDAQRAEYATIHAKVAGEFLDPVQSKFNGELAKLGAPPLPVGFLESTIKLPDLFLQPSVPSLEYPVRNMPPSVHFIGALPMPPAESRLPDWADEIDGKRRVVFVTQGTVANHDLGQVIAPTLAALANETDVLVLAATGGRPLEAIPGPIPSNARLATFLPFDWLMPKLDLIVTNGGYGTVAHALSLGIPLIVAGLTEDKAEVSARVAWSGAGINLATNSPTPEALRAAVREALDTPRYRERAAAIAREFAGYNAEKEIIRLLHETVGISAGA